MSFFSKALKGAERFLEQVDEGVSKASKRLEESAKAVTAIANNEGDDDDDDEEDEYDEDDEEGEYEDDGEEGNYEEEGDPEGWDEEWDEDWNELDEELEAELDEGDAGSAGQALQDEQLFAPVPQTQISATETGIDQATHVYSVGQEKGTTLRGTEVPTEKARGENVTETAQQRREKISVEEASAAAVAAAVEDALAAAFPSETSRIDEDSTLQAGAELEYAVEARSAAASQQSMPAEESASLVGGSENLGDGEVGQLNALCSLLRTEADTAKQFTRTLEASVRELKAELETSAAQVKALTAAKKKSDGLKAKIQRETLQLREQVGAAAEDKRALEEEVQKNVDQQRSLKNALSKAENEFTTAKDKVEQLSRENRTLVAELDSAEGDLDKLRHEKEFSARNMKQTTELTNHLEKENRDLKVKLGKMDDQKRQDRDQWKAQLENSEKLVKKLEAKVSKADDELMKAKSEAESRIQTSSASLTKLLNEAKVDKAVVEAENERLREIIARDKQAGEASSDSARREVNSALAELDREMEAHRRTEKAARLREEALESAAAEAADALAQAERRAQSEREAMVKMSEELKDTKHQLSAEQMARSDAQLRLETLEQGEANLAGAEARLEQSAQQIEKCQAQIDQLEEELRMKDAQIEELENSVKAVSGRRNGPEIAEMETQVRSLADATIHKQGQVEVLRGENKALQLQLEKEKKRTQEAQSVLQSMSTRAGGDTDGSKLNTSRLGQRMKPVGAFLEQFDRLALRFISAIRREPPLRMVFVLYFVFTHVFTYFVLHHTTYQMHADAPEHGGLARLHNSS